MEEIKLNVEQNKNFISIKNIIIMILIVVIVLFGYNKLTKKKSYDSVSSQSELIKVLDENKLNTAKYYYNGITEKKNKNGDVQYYVTYEGTVTVGIDFNEIVYEEDPINKRIIVKIPELKINTINVNATSLDFIKINNKLKIEDIHSEAFGLAENHLRNTINTDKDFYAKAKENTIKIIKGLIEPLMKSKNSDYKLEILDK